MNEKGEAFSVTGLQFVMVGDEEQTVEDSKGGGHTAGGLGELGAGSGCRICSSSL